jgi:hypothetical protein
MTRVCSSRYADVSPSVTKVPVDRNRDVVGPAKQGHSLLGRLQLGADIGEIAIGQRCLARAHMLGRVQSDGRRNENILPAFLVRIIFRMGTGQAVGISPQRDQLPRQVALDPAEPGGNRRCPVVETDKIFRVALAQHDVNDDHAVFVFEQVILGDKRHPRPDLQPPGFETDEQLIAIGVAGLVQRGVVKRDLDLAAIALLDRDVLDQLKIVPAGQRFLSRLPAGYAREQRHPSCHRG